MRIAVALLAVSPLVAAETVKPADPPKVHARPAPPKAEGVKAAAQPAAKAEVKTEATKTKSETLQFSVNWPSGLSLGEGQIASSFNGREWSFSMNVDAAIPAFAVSESAKSRATADLCSMELTREATRGKRITSETTTFDSSKLIATRQTGKGGGQTEIRINACAKDALTFIQFMRRELAAGRLPAAQQVFFGSGYATRVQYTGAVKVVQEGQYVDADKLQATIKGPASEFTVDLLFLRDAARTPLQAQIPVSVGKFTVEFSR